MRNPKVNKLTRGDEMKRKDIEQFLAAKALMYAIAGKIEKSEKIRSILLKIQRKDEALAI